MLFLIKKLWWVAMVWFRRVLLIAFSFLVVLQREREREERENVRVCVCVYTVYLLICFLSVDQCNCGLFIVVMSSLKSDVHAPHSVHVRVCVCTLSFFLSLSLSNNLSVGETKGIITVRQTVAYLQTLERERA